MSPGHKHPGAAPVVSFERVSKAYGTIRAVDGLSLERSRPGPEPSLPPNAYVAAKVIGSMVTTVPAVAIVLALGRFYGGIHLALWKWLAIGGVIWLGSLTFAALAVAIGYRFTPDRVQPVAMFVYFVMSILGGLWFALAGWMQQVGQALPTYQITRVATSLVGGGPVSMTSIGIVLAWFAAFALLAVLAVRSTAETV